MGSGPTRHVRRRLKKKTPAPGRRTGSTKDAPSARDRAIQSGLIPTARNDYALFTRDEMKKDTHAGESWPVASKKLSRAWKELSAENKNKYQAEAESERQQQHQAMVEHGLRKERLQDVDVALGGVTPAADSARVGEATTLHFGKYSILQTDEIGRGTYGQVVLAKEKTTERRVALKVFESQQEAEYEIAMCKHLWTLGGHRCILALLGSVTTPPTPFMVMPYVAEANLFKFMKEGSL